MEKGYVKRWGAITYEDDDGTIRTEVIPEPKGGRQRVKDDLLKHANATLPPGTRFQIREWPAELGGGRGHGMAWYHGPDMEPISGSQWGTIPPHSIDTGLGYRLVGEFTTKSS